MKKKLVALLTAVALVLSLAACGGKTDEAAKDEKVTLRMAWWGSQNRHDKTVEVINMYMKENPNVKIEYEFFSFDDYFTKLKTLVASDNVWDVFQLGGNFPEYVNKIAYLNDYIKDGTIDTKNIPEGYLKITQDFEGNQIGLSNGINTYGIAYDVDMFKAAGVPEPTSEWTWDDYADAARKIKKATGHYGSSSFTSSEFIAGCSSYIGQQGEVGEYSFFNIDLTGMGFKDAQMLTPYIQMRADLIKEGAYPDAGAELEITNIENDFLATGEAAMTWIATNQISSLTKAVGPQNRNLKIATVPKVKKGGASGMVLQSSQMLCVSKDSKNQKEAAKFISWFQNSTDCNKVLNGERGIPINDKCREVVKSQISDTDEGKGLALAFDYVSLVGSFKTPDKVNVLSPDGQDKVVDLYRKSIQQVVSGEITAAEAADITYKAAEELFK